MSDTIISDLYQVLLDRKNAAPETSYVASLYAGGGEKIGRKITEEASEVLIEAVKGNAKLIMSESADLLFHMMALWAHFDITPADVTDILNTRMGVGGLEEKANRSK